MTPIVTPEEMREVDASTVIPFDALIARAGWHVARRARAMLGGVYGRRVAVIAGPGNNGADARVAARLLASWGVRVTIVAPHATELPACDLVIDGAFGTGANRPFHPAHPAAGTLVLAIDIPSGVDGLTGASHGSPLHADHTVTFAALKPGLLLHPGAELAGTLEVVDIGLDVASASAWRIEESDARHLAPRRAPDTHKWKRAVWVIGGSPGMYGAPLLASQAALRSGTGVVWCGLPGQAAPGLATEVVFQPLPAHGWHRTVIADADRFGAFVVGCGLGRSEEAAQSVQGFVEASTQPLVIDGDALRLLGPNPSLRPNIVLTPHDGEFAALAGAPPGADRFAAARSLSVQTNATVLLKGPTTIVARPDGHCLVSASGDQRLATAGSGDVLAGLIGSFLASGLSADQAAGLGAWVHGAAAMTQRRVGTIASDLVDGLSLVIERLDASH